MAHPLRVQRSRQRKDACPPGTVYVGRPGIFGNPFGNREDGTGGTAVEMFEAWLTWPLDEFLGCTMPDSPSVTDWIRFCEERCCTLLRVPTPEMKQAMLDALPGLKGKNLSCWCPLNKPCHADVLCELANK